MTNKELQEWIKVNLLTSNGNINSNKLKCNTNFYKNNIDILNIIDIFFDNNISICIKAKHILNNIFEYPKCKCGKNVSTDRGKFCQFCSIECSAKYKDYSNHKGNNLKILDYKNFISKANKIHDNKYEYVLYNSNILLKDKIKIICPKHGEFNQLVYIHLKGHGCTKCANNITRKKTQEEFINKANEVHNNKYCYDKLNYINGSTKITIKCSKHGYWNTTTADSHLQGTGCPECANILRVKKFRKLYYNGPTTLYYVKIEKEGFSPVWKIGITKNNINQRFKEDINNGIKFTILKEEHFNTGESAYYKEQLVLNSLKEYKYYGDNILLSGGNSELFIKDCYLITF